MSKKIGLALILVCMASVTAFGFNAVEEAAKTRQQQEMVPGHSSYVVREGPILGFSSLAVASKFVTRAKRLSDKALLRELEKLRRSGSIIDFNVNELVNAIRMDEKSGLMLVTKRLSPGEWWIAGAFIEKYDKPGLEKPTQQSARFDPVAEAAKTRQQQEVKKETADDTEAEVNEVLKRFKEDSEESLRTHNKNRTALAKAVEDGDLKMAKSLIAKGANVNAQDKFGYTALMYAAQGGYLEIVKLLLDKDANVTAKSADGDTALTMAYHERNGDHWREVVKLLIDKGADVNAKAGEDTVLKSAVCGNDPEIVQLLVDKGADVNARETGENTVLIWAVLCRNAPEIVQLLIDKGANVNAKTKDGYTALMSDVSWKIRPPRPDIVKLLIDNGADVNAKTTEEGYTVLMEAVGCPASGVSIEVVKLLLDSGADINGRGIDGSTTLMRAVTCLRGGLPIEVVKLLLARGANVNAKDHRGNTAFLEACDVQEPTRIEALNLLVSRGADINAKINDKYGALLTAKIRDDKELIRWLEAHGVK